MPGANFAAQVISSSRFGNDQYTRILLPFSGTDGSTSFRDICHGATPHTFTANGNAQIDTAQSKFGGSSGLFDGTGDYISTPDSGDFTLGSSDFTFDCWFNWSGGSGVRGIFGAQADSGGTAAATPWVLDHNTTNVMRGLVSNGAGFTVVTGTTAITTTGWHHYAFVRTGNTLKLFIDGTQEGGDVAFASSVVNSSNLLAIGQGGEFTTSPWDGWIDEFRLSVGIARWTANFTPPTIPYS
jgi:hypothetical protein